MHCKHEHVQVDCFLWCKAWWKTKDMIESKKNNLHSDSHTWLSTNDCLASDFPACTKRKYRGTFQLWWLYNFQPETSLDSRFHNVKRHLIIATAPSASLPVNDPMDQSNLSSNIIKHHQSCFHDVQNKKGLQPLFFLSRKCLEGQLKTRSAEWALFSPPGASNILLLPT